MRLIKQTSHGSDIFQKENNDLIKHIFYLECQLFAKMNSYQLIEQKKDKKCFNPAERQQLYSEIRTVFLKLIQIVTDLCPSLTSEVGISLFNSGLDQYPELKRFAQSPHIFCPIPYFYYQLLFTNFMIDFTEKTYAVHFWNEMLRLKEIDSAGLFHENSFFERTYRRHFAI